MPATAKKKPVGSPTLRIALPRFYSGSVDAAVLVIHGFMSYPGILDNLSDALHGAGFTVSVPRLPGHGTNADDFHKSTWKDWFRRCEDEYLDLRARFDTVHVVGSSAGGVLALLLASLYPVSKMVLLAPAIINTNRLILISGLFKHFIRRVRDDRDLEGHDEDNPEVLYLADEYWSWMWPGPSHELLKLQRRTRKTLGGISADTLILMSAEDTAVPMGAAALIKEKITSRCVKISVFHRSNHHLSSHVEKEKVADATVAWFEH